MRRVAQLLEETDSTKTYSNPFARLHLSEGFDLITNLLLPSGIPLLRYHQIGLVLNLFERCVLNRCEHISWYCSWCIACPIFGQAAKWLHLKKHSATSGCIRGCLFAGERLDVTDANILVILFAASISLRAL